MSNGRICRKPTAFVAKMFRAQRGRCFHCGEPMALIVPRGAPKNLGVTREHLFPKRGTGWGMANNVVLAHPVCNETKAAREPTDEEIERARSLYALLGWPAFVPFIATATTESGRRAEMKAALKQAMQGQKSGRPLPARVQTMQRELCPEMATA